MSTNLTKNVIVVLLIVIILSAIAIIFFYVYKGSKDKVDRTTIEKILSINKIDNFSDLQIDKSYITDNKIEDESVKDYIELNIENDIISMYLHKDNGAAMEMYDFHKDNCSKLYDAIEGKYCTIYETKVDENKKYFYTNYVNIVDDKFMLYPTGDKSREVVILIGDLVIKIADMVGESNKNNINELLDYVNSILTQNISR